MVVAVLSPALALSAPVDYQIKQIDSQINQKKQEVESTQGRLGNLKTDLDSLIKEYQEAYFKLQEIDEKIAKKQRELNSAVEQQLFYQKILNKLSVFAYRDGDIYFLEVVLGTRSFKDLIVRVDYLNKLSHRQAEVLQASKRLRKVVQANRDVLALEKNRQRELVSAIQTKQDEISRLLAEEQAMLNSLGSDISNLETERTKKEEQKRSAAARPGRGADGGPANIDMIFPIPTPYAHSYINDWGFARAGNASGHQGTDIFAAKGTPVVAVADGVITDEFGFLRVGGYRLHVMADNGVNYYYAHLNNDTPGTDDGLGAASTAYAPGIAPGVRVSKGQIIGYVGDSGDAEPTPPHLHFGIEINDDWVNPYPHLVTSDWR